MGTYNSQPYRAEPLGSTYAVPTQSYVQTMQAVPTQSVTTVAQMPTVQTIQQVIAPPTVSTYTSTPTPVFYSAPKSEMQPQQTYLQPFNFEFGANTAPQATRGMSMEREKPAEQVPFSDPVLEKDMAKLDQIANMKATPQGMEIQIQELVAEQRSLKNDLEDIKAQINENFTELEYLKNVADMARHHMTQPRGLPPQQTAPTPPAVSKAPPPVKTTGPPANLGYGENLGDQMYGHFNTLSGHVQRHTNNAMEAMSSMRAKPAQ